jgi:hypothetical protein
VITRYGSPNVLERRERADFAAFNKIMKRKGASGRCQRMSSNLSSTHSWHAAEDALPHVSVDAPGGSHPQMRRKRKREERNSMW